MTISVEYGVPTDKCGIQLRLGIERGFFRAEGLDLSLRVVFGGPEIASAYDTGTLVVGELGTPPGLTAIAHGGRFRIVGGSVRRGAVQSLVVAPSFQTWADLVGARIGVLSRGSCSDWFLRAILRHHAIDPDRDVTIVGLGPRYPGVVDLFASGELDAALIAEPNISMGEDRGLFRAWLGLNRVGYVPRIQWCIAVANAATLEAEPELVAAVLRGCRRSYRHAADHPDEWRRFGARHFGLPEHVMAAAIERELPDLHFDCEVDVPGLEAAIRLQRDAGAFTTPLAVADIVDFRFQPAARSAA